MLTCYWDLETTDFDGHWARILASAIKPHGKKPMVMMNPRLYVNPSTDMGKRSCDRELLVWTRDNLEKFDIIVTYYGGPSRFDLPMLNTRLLRHGEKPLSPKFHLDLYPRVKANLRFKRNNLAIVCKFFGWDDKVTMNPDDWVEAAWDGNRKAIANIRRRVTGDVTALEKLLGILKPFVKGMKREG